MTTRRGMGQLEAEILAILWSEGGWMTPRSVLERLDSDPPVVYSTAMTILRRLWKKGTLDRRRVGKAYEYRPLKDEGEQTADRMAEVLSAASDPDAALVHFLGTLDARHRRHLRSILDERRR